MSGERTTYQYDFQGNLVGERVYNTLSYTYANQLYEINNNFDDDGNIIKNALQTHVGTLTTNYAYDAESGLPSSVTLFGGRQVSYTYDDEGTLTGRSLSTNTPVNESFSLNDDGLISTHTIAHGTDSNAYSYTYDDNYNITEIKKGNIVQQSYEYDALNQLTRENDRDTGKTVTYSYDGYGNITTKTEYAFTLGELGTAVDTVSYNYDNVWKDKLKFYDGVEIHYDDIGNPTNYMGADMTWFGRQMMSYSKNGTNISYTYDADGLRTSKTVNGVKHNYYYVDGQLRYERNGDSYEIYYTYDADGRPVLATKRDLVAQKNYQYYLITNTRGDVIETRNGDGNVNAKFVYDAWGKLVSVTDANGNALSTDSFAYQISLKYRGYVYDNETGLYYLQSRYYDPETGRFLNADDVRYIGYSGEQLSYNIFAYCENNAVCCIDICGFITERINIRLRDGFTNTALKAVLNYILNGKTINQFIEYSRNKNYIYTAIVEYIENTGIYSGKYRKVELTFGNKKQWADNSKWVANFNDLTWGITDVVGSMAQDVRAQDDLYGIAIPLIFMLGLWLGEYYKASQSKNNYNLVWGKNGIDPYDYCGYYLFEVKWQGNSKREYYVYSLIYNSVGGLNV